MRRIYSTSVTRREFVSGLGAGTVALGAGRLRAAEATDVIVLGAGLSGLYTSMLLEEQGYRVTLLEASDHVGGRVQTRNTGGIRTSAGYATNWVPATSV